MTYQVYANMTRFQWAYPSGASDSRDEQIRGPTMVLATIIMSMVYLVAETRLKMQEPGINDPDTKLLVTILTFAILFGLRVGGVLEAPLPTATAAISTDISTAAATNSISTGALAALALSPSQLAAVAAANATTGRFAGALTVGDIY